MIKNNREKIVKTFISFVITFLIIFIVVVVLRALTLNINSTDSKVHAFLKDYFDVMHTKTEAIASKFKIKSDNVSEYQRNLISQSVNDYASLLKYQTYDISRDFNPNTKLSPSAVDSYKEKFYKMILENPYIMSITFFAENGSMKLNMFSVKGITIELSEELREKTRGQGSIFLHAENENALYTIMYVQNEHGSFYVATRNDYIFVSDLIAYYQIPENSFMITDSYNVTQRIEQNDISLMKEAAKDNISSIISRYAYYKQEPAFSIDSESSLMVSMVSRNYPNYFELILISLTALMIVIAQNIIVFLFNMIKKAFPMVFAPKEDVEAKKAASIINNSIIEDEQQLAYEGMSLENVLGFNENMRNDSNNLYAERALARDDVRHFSSGADLDEELIDDEIDDNNDSVYDDSDTLSHNSENQDVQEDIDIDDNYQDQELHDYEEKIADDVYADDNSGEESDIDTVNSYAEQNSNSYNSDIEQSSYVEQKETSLNTNYQENIHDNIDVAPQQKEIKKYNNRSVDDIFASFDSLLESIISKAEQNGVAKDDDDNSEG